MWLEVTWRMTQIITIFSKRASSLSNDIGAAEMGPPRFGRWVRNRSLARLIEARLGQGGGDAG